jgi:sodium/hydrogen exchanger 10/11
MTLIRAIMILALWPLLNLAGVSISAKEAFVMVWSGLRGAVGLAMAIIVDREPDVPTQMGSRVMFHIGGLAALTTIINATTSAPLLKYLDLTSTSEVKQMCLSNMSVKIADDIRLQFEEKMENHDDVRCQGANEHIVRAMVPALTKRISAVRNIYSSNEETSLADDPSYVASVSEIYRRIFLQVVKTHYWEAIEDGMLPKCGPTARVLLESVEEALDCTDRPLCDWACLEKKIKLGKIAEPPSFLSHVVTIWPFSLSRDLEAAFSKEKQVEFIVNAAW